MRTQACTSRSLAALALILVASVGYSQVRVINMIPANLSNETQRDSEPSVAVDPANTQRIAASAFTPDPAASGSGPIFVSTDGGNNWVLNVVLPGGNRTGDTSIRFGRSSGVLYGGILRSDVALRMNILRAANFTAAGLMNILVTRDNEDQPWVEATTSGGADRVFVGNNNLGVTTNPRQTASVDRSQNAATAAAPAGFSTTVVEARSTGTANQDGPPVRTAHHSDGTVYGVFFGWTAAGMGSTFTSDVVVVRDDSWASGATPFAALTDGNVAGKRVVTGVTIVFNQMLGNQRTGGQAAIAVDPTNSNTVYIAWCDGTPTYTLHLRRSTNRGVDWSPDRRTITNATNPGLAITSTGRVGFMYQRLVTRNAANRWQTHLEYSTDAFATSTDVTLADVPDSLGTYVGSNPIGDYANVIAVGPTFYGVFSAFNTPDNANFPNGVTYQRNANFTNRQLLDNNGTTVVADSIDPFFFTITGPTTLTVRKIIVHPDHNHLRLFTVKIDGVTVRANFNGGIAGPRTVTPGNHTVSETGGTGTSLAAFHKVFGGACAANGTVNLARGDSKTCTITNYDNYGGCATNKKCCEPGTGTQGCQRCVLKTQQCP